MQIRRTMSWKYFCYTIKSFHPDCCQYKYDSLGVKFYDLHIRCLLWHEARVQHKDILEVVVCCLKLRVVKAVPKVS
jgi:hypothetical protein